MSGNQYQKAKTWISTSHGHGTELHNRTALQNTNKVLNRNPRISRQRPEELENLKTFCDKNSNGLS